MREFPGLLAARLHAWISEKSSLWDTVSSNREHLAPEQTYYTHIPTYMHAYIYIHRYRSKGKINCFVIK